MDRMTQAEIETIRMSETEEDEDTDRRTNMDDFINSIRESTFEDDVIAYH